jgi:hypothetical protein
MPGWRPRKGDCAGGSTASDMAAVVVSLLGHVDGVERTVGDLGVGSASVLAAPRSRFGDLTRGQRAAKFSGAVRGFFFGRKLSASAPAAAMPVGVVTLLGASVWLSSPRYGSR